MLGKVDGRESLRRKKDDGRDGYLVSVHDTYILYRLQVYRIILRSQEGYNSHRPQL